MIRTLTAADAATMASLHATAFDPAWPGSEMEDHIKRDLVLGHGDPVTGFIIVRPVADQAEILTIVIDPDRRGQGIARDLLIAAEQAAAEIGVEVLFLEVAEDNQPALALYRSAKFEAFGRRPAYYRRKKGRVAALTFRKKLDGVGADS